MKRILVALILVLATNAASAQQRPTLQALAIPQGERIDCEESPVGAPREQVVMTPGRSTNELVVRTYTLSRRPPFDIPARTINVSQDSTRGFWILSDIASDGHIGELVTIVASNGGIRVSRRRTAMDTAAARAAIEAGDTSAFRKAAKDTVLEVTDADRQAGQRLMDWLRSVPCTKAGPIHMWNPSAPFIIMTVDTMPRIVPPESRYAVVRRPDEEIMDVVVIRKDALGIAVLDTAIAMLRVARARELDPGRPTAVVKVNGVPTMDSLLATKSFERLARAEVRDVVLVGRGPAIDVPVLERQGGVMVRPARPRSQK